MDENFRVASRRESMAAALEVGPQFAIVVDLPVLDDLDRSVLVADRLVSARQIDDRKPSHRERDRAVDERAGAVRPSVDEGLVHGSDDGRVDLGVGCDPADTAHG
jgi:hypothetical protein